MTTTNQGEKFNITFDLGHFLVNDAQTFNKDAITEAEIKQRTITNLELFYKELFKLSGKQAGEDSENRDFDKPKDCVKLPDPVLKLPRAKPIPKPKPLTKWEKYRVEKGLPPREKRSRMVFSELAQDWVPRWGKGSAKNIEEKAEWALEERKGEEGQNPFTLRKQEKQLGRLKEKKKELSNFENGQKEQNKRNKAAGEVQEGKINSKEIKKQQAESSIQNKKENRKAQAQGKGRAKMNGKSQKLDEDKKGLGTVLERVQKSTASMGKFDRKVKNEKVLNPLKKNKISKDILLNRKSERDRDRKILDNILGGKNKPSVLGAGKKSKIAGGKAGKKSKTN